MRSRVAIVSFSVAAGTFVTLCLLLSITLLANYRAHAKEPRPLLVVELTTWPAPVKQEKQKPPPKPKQQPVPQEKVAKKSLPPKLQPEPELAPVAKNIVREKLPEPVEPDSAQPTPSTLVKSVEDILPTPVPIFQLTRAPRFLHREVPVYPEVMRVQGVSGVVKLEALIDKEGRVRRVSILKSAGEKFDAAAKRAILASSFYPAEVGHEPVAVLLRLPVKFNLL